MSINPAGTVSVAILSDTHGHVFPNVMAVVAGCDVAVHAGDIGTSRALQQLQSVIAAVHAVRGNNDVPGLWANHEWGVLKTLPRITEIQLPGGRLAAEHGDANGHTSRDLGGLRAAHPRALWKTARLPRKAQAPCQKDSIGGLL